MKLRHMLLLLVLLCCPRALERSISQALERSSARALERSSVRALERSSSHSLPCGAAVGWLSSTFASSWANRAAFDRYDRYGNCSICSIDPIDSIFEKVRKIQNATFEGIKPIVPGFFRIGFRFERILGRSA